MNTATCCKRRATCLVSLTLLLVALPASAYVGPGAGVSFLGSLFSTLWVLVLALFTILFWPIRYAYKRSLRLIREMRHGPQPEAAEASEISQKAEQTEQAASPGQTRE